MRGSSDPSERVRAPLRSDTPSTLYPLPPSLPSLASQPGRDGPVAKVDALEVERRELCARAEAEEAAAGLVGPGEGKASRSARRLASEAGG